MVAWLRRHRVAVLIVGTLLLGTFLPVPGFIAAALFFPEGVHSTNFNGIEFLGLLFGVSMVVWAAVLNAVLPKGA